MRLTAVSTAKPIPRPLANRVDYSPVSLVIFDFIRDDDWFASDPPIGIY